MRLPQSKIQILATIFVLKVFSIRYQEVFKKGVKRWDRVPSSLATTHSTKDLKES